MRVGLLLAALVCLETGPARPATKDLGQGFLDHGVATPSSCHRGAVATADGQGRPLFLAWLMDHRGSYALLLIDVDAGKAEERPVTFPLGDSPFASILSSRGKFYSHFGSHFVEFDPAQRSFTVCRKTAPQMAMSMTEDQHGVIWSATYPQSGLVSFDPQTGVFNDYGQLYQQNWAQYPRSVAADDAGWVYLGVGSTACQIIAFDPGSRRVVPLVPESERTHGSAAVFPGTDGKVYGRPNSTPADNWLVLYQGKATRLGQRPKFTERPLVAGSQGLYHRVFPDGRRVRDFDLLESILVVEDPTTKTQKTIRFEYHSEGAHVMGVAAAPGGTICGGSAFPMRFFSYDPRRNAWVRHTALGQWNTIGRQGDQFFVGAYPGGHLLQWDPAAAWVDTVEGHQDCNPRVLTRCSPTIIRPARLLAHPDGRTIIVGGTPAYGTTGGGLLFWDRSRGERVLLTHEQVVPQQATMSLVALPGGKLLGGTTTSPGTGGQRKAQQAELYLLDEATKKIEWHAPVFPGVQDYTDLYLGPDGLVWGFADRTVFFVFDPASRKVVRQESIAREFGATVSHQGPRVFVRGPQDDIYVLFVRAIARIEPQNWRIKLVAKSPVPLDAGGDWLDGRIWFASGSHLYSYRLRKEKGDYFPPPESQGGWRKLEKPDDIRRLSGMDPAKLGELRQWLLKSDNRPFAAVVIRHGYIVLEVERGNSAKTDARRVASVSKAVCATVLAIASEQSRQGRTPRRMTFDDPALGFIPWAKPLSDPRKASITVKQLLNHTSGICPEATGAPNDGSWQYVLGHSGDARTASLAFDPGTACGYSTHALAHAALVCENVTGKPYDQFAVEALFKPLGIERWWFQYYEGGEKIGRHPSHGLGMPARDLARIAYCMMRGGRWGSQQVIPPWFVEETAAPTHGVTTPEMRWKLNPQVFSHGWELPARHKGESGRSGQGIPADARSKPGSGGQLIAFVPSLDLVITRQTGSSGQWEYEEYLRRACAAVLSGKPDEPEKAETW